MQPCLEEGGNPRLETCPCATCDRASDHPSDGQVLGFPGGPVLKSLPCNAGDVGSIPGLGRSHMPWSN